MRAVSRASRKSLLSSYAADLGSLISRRRSENALRAASMESAMANRAKSEFLANMSHELRTPLNAIIGFADLIQVPVAAETGPGKSMEYASYIAQGGRDLLKILNDILDLSRIEIDNFELNLEQHSIRDIIETSIDLVQARASDKKQTLHVRVNDDLPPIVVDETRIKQALSNILSNAVTFTQEGGAIFVIAKADANSISVEITDTGIGMTDEQMAYALKPFTQVKPARTRNHAGTGLGLPISKALVLRHGGTFRISSKPGVGTTVAFSLRTDGVARTLERRDTPGSQPANQ
jgi:two-component system cell cycle sensor histidine kinase PleC